MDTDSFSLPEGATPAKKARSVVDIQQTIVKNITTLV